MGRRGNKRKRERSQEEAVVDAALSEVNDILQGDDRSQKETWQIGKRLKKLMEEHPKMTQKQTLDAFFLWGTALARLASQNEDATLAEAAVDKFQEMHKLSGGDEAAMGPVGYSLWASALLIIATENQDREVLDQSLEKFQQAVEVDGGTTFESRFQYARALKEGADLVKFLETEAAQATGTARQTDHRSYYKRALELCEEMERIYAEEATKPKEDAKKGDGDDDDDDEDSEEDDDEDEVDPDDDVVHVDDLAEVKLLEAILHGMLEEDEDDDTVDPVACFERTFALFKRALELNSENPGVLMEMASYVGKKCKARLQIEDLHNVGWGKILSFLEEQYRIALASVDFPMTECHEICVRKDTRQEEEPEGEENTDAQVPHLLHAFGRSLVGFLIGEAAKPVAKPTLAALMKLKKNKGKAKATSSSQAAGTGHPRYIQAVEALRSAHHFHDKLGCYPLACLYAAKGYENEEQCRIWLETAETYGVLDDEFVVEDFAAFQDKPWFQKFTQPVEEIAPGAETAQVGK
ncbi:hypothetical protein Poli38472_004457 [Pythium oligandrum]|uniref:Uncharacterized protein n=1 Tax=Pythium oligandrum TaxID=41045 RepID=A0A8K1CAF9_PYTOL|nr:hypothetical protein Poli38472_004457 [Pythium oligandrum]|eukprot:TMW59388.1 hypothetical protein Poli38472_004457 [Pythium oligandrum]